MERFLRYSLDKQRPIRLMYMEEDGQMRQVNAQISAMDGATVCFTCLRPKGVFTIRMEQILSADYKRGDEGQA